MKKLIILSFLATFSTLILSSCSAPLLESHTGTIEKTNLTQKKLHEIIKKTCMNAGWRITEFKSNAMIAEKSDGDNATVATISFSKSSYDITPHNSELARVIDSALN